MLRPLLYIFSCCLSLASVTVEAQSFYSKNFRAADGLAADLTKCVIQDKLGFIWVGSDNGLVRYDGYSFESFENSTASNYIKHLEYDKDSSIIVAHDLGLTRITYGDGIKPFFNTIRAGQRTKTDTTLWYPKKVYRDTRDNIWVAEPQSVVKLGNESFRRFDFADSENSTSFVESFNFLQLDEKQLLITSFPGNIFVYDYENDTIRQVSKNPQVGEIHIAQRIADSILLGCRNGIYLLDEMQYSTSLLLLGGPYVDIKRLEEGRLLACLENESVIILERKADKLKIKNSQIASNKPNQIFESGDETIWISSERGLTQLSRPQLQELGAIESFIEAVIPSNFDNSLYLLSKEDIWKVDSKTLEVGKIVSNQSSYFLTGVASKGSLWVGDNFELLQIKDDIIVNRFDLSKYGRFVFEVARDPDGNLWISQESGIGLLRFNIDNFEIDRLDQQDSLDVEVTAFECIPEGIYASSIDPSKYLLYKNHSEPYFKNISLPLPENIEEDFAIGDIEVVDSVVYLSTNKGLYRQYSDTLERVTFNRDYDRVAVTSLMYDGYYLWFGNTYGLFQMNLQTGEYAYFNEKSGLPINGVNEEAIKQLGDTLWIGTSAGVGLLSKSSLQKRKPIAPSIISLTSNSTRVAELNKTINLPHNSLVEVEYSSLSYPSDRVYYSYFLQGFGRDWSPPRNSNSVRFADLPSGDYTLFLKSKKLGDITWSDPSSIRFTIDRSFYESSFFYALLAAIVILLIVITRALTGFIHKRRQKSLEKIVQERTSELNSYRENLETLVENRTIELQKTLKQLQEAQSQLVHTEKMASLGVLSAGVAHEINNPLNFIKGSLIKIKEEVRENQDTVRYIEILEQGISRISDIVRSLSNFSHKGTEITEECDIHEILENCLMILKNRLKYKVELDKHYCQEDFIITGNSGALHQVFINLLSNAEQAIEESGKISIKTTIDDSFLKIEIEDTGCGISEDNLSRITDPFFTTKPQGEGTGLGLHISYDIIRKHNGSIDLVSEVGAGTTFTVRLPLSQNETTKENQTTEKDSQ